jgi:hypothetical protein
MKYCPNCQTRYTDDTLKFCLQDGALLVADSEEAAPTVVFDEAETVVTPRQVEPLLIEVPQTSAPETFAPNAEQYPKMHIPAAQIAPPKKSRTFLTVLLTGLLTLLLLGAGGLGVWLYMRNKQAEVAKNTVSNNQILNTNSNTKSNVRNSPSPTATPRNQNDSNAANANSAAPPPSVNVEQVKGEVSSRIDSWVDLTESRNLNAYMNHYAGTVDYYNKKDVSTSYIRSDKQRAFNDFDSIEMNVSNLNVKPDASGERATAEFDKEWVFDGDEKYSAGKVRTQLQLKKVNGQWLIVGERDLKVYYTE